MKEVEIVKIIKMADSLSENNETWHFHMLGKDCEFNDEKGKYKIIFENEKAGETLYTIFTKKPLEKSKILADKMYGQAFLDSQEYGQHSPSFDMILRRVEVLAEEGVEWHHHHLHPNCILNKEKGKHCIVLEDPRTKEMLSATYSQKPMKDLVKIERLFYEDLQVENIGQEI